jgi:L-ascorbate metabolism protein UlaG (beta-lactamase superfamily)
MSVMPARLLLPLLSFTAALGLASCSRAGATTTPASVAPSSGAHGPMTLTHLGVAGWKLSSPSGTLLVDPYVSRRPVEDWGATLVPDEAAIAAFTPSKADAVLVGHSHYDHALDVPAIARRTGATVIGTESTGNLAAAGGVPGAQIRVAHGGETFDVGPFSVRTVAARHSLTGQENVPIPRTITLPMAARAYGEGGTLQYLVRFEGRSIYFVGTANLVEEEVRALGAKPDVAVVATGFRQKVPQYTCRLLDALGRPKLVLPNHFDDFDAPVRPGQLNIDAETRADLDAFVAEVEACAPGTRVEVPVLLKSIEL